MEKQECLGCGKVIYELDWFRHSQECVELERVTEMALRALWPPVRWVEDYSEQVEWRVI